MREFVEFDAATVMPDPALVMAHLGVPPGEPTARNQPALRAAMDLFASHAAPEGLLEEVSVDAFVQVFRGEDLNEPVTPLGQIFPRADRLALFAVTVGEDVSQEIMRRFGSRDFVLGSMLDAVASEATERVGEQLERRYRELLGPHRIGGAALGVLRYSPGYCGWHISGQRKLFDTLRPEEIGISLRESYLMQPLKSISGVIVAGASEIHTFEDNYPFCRECRTRGCRSRIRRLAESR